MPRLGFQVKRFNKVEHLSINRNCLSYYFFVVSFGRLSFYLCFLFYYVALLPIVDPCAAAVFFFYLLLRLVMQFNVFEAVR